MTVIEKPDGDVLINPGEVAVSKMSERYWDIIIIITSGIILLLTFYCLLAGITTVFMHLYYFPIILLAYRYQKKGVAYSVSISLIYFFMVVWFQHSQIIEIAGALLRVLSFTGVAIVVAYLSIIISQKQQEYLAVSRFNESVVSNANVWLAVLDAKGTVLVWNKAAEEISGYSSGEVIGKNTLWKCLYPEHDYRKKVTGTITTILKESKFFENFETVIVARGGRNKTISWNTRAIPDNQGSSHRFVAIGIDITGRKQAEEKLRALSRELEDRVKARTFELNKTNEVLETEIGQRRQTEEKLRLTNDELQAAVEELNATEKSLKEYVGKLEETSLIVGESEERYRLITEAITDYIYTVRVDNGQVTDTTHGEGCIAVTGYTSREFASNPYLWIEMVVKEDRPLVEEHAQKVLTEKKSRIIEHRITRKDGTQRWVRNTAVPRYDPQGRFVAYEGLVQDITERKQLEEQILKSLAEKEMLLKEIHHRVKNNLQIIASVLNLQIRRIDDPKTIEALKDCQSRVRSMSLVHEQLHRGKDISHVNLGNYLRALGTVLFNSYDVRDRGVRFELDIPEINVDINTAIPLGLISNELVTNCLKYAFKEKTGGILSITAREDPAALTFVVADNGAGMAPDITLENQTSLGLQLVSSLTDQLNGTVVIDRTGGTKFTFTFPRPAETPGTAGL